MKRLFVSVFLLCSLNAVHATPKLFRDSSRTFIQSRDGVQDTIMVPVLNAAQVSPYQGSIYKRRLDSIQKEVPLDYNPYVQSYIDTYTMGNQRESLGRILGLTKYYFPIYEKVFHEAGIPEEIKYLSIVESQLNPNAVSRVGATGPWQFMGPTAKIYGLNIDTYVDERRDPIQSSYAAAAYLKDAYQQFGDWLTAIASYNCGKSNVLRAIEQAGGATDFWSIQKYLPVETRGYVPAYIAVTYVMNYYKKYNIVPQSSGLSVMKTDTVLVSKFVSLNSVARVLNISLAQLTQLNPSYKVMIINGSPESPKTLVIPQSAKDKYNTLYKSINADLGYIGFDRNTIKYSADKAAETELNSYYRSKKRSRRNPDRQYFSYSVNRKAQQISKG